MFLFFALCGAVPENFPVLSTECDAGKVWNSVLYACVPCTSPYYYESSLKSCVINISAEIVGPDGNTSVIGCIGNTSRILIGDFCYEKAEFDAFRNLSVTVGSNNVLFNNVIKSFAQNSQIIAMNFSNELTEMYRDCLAKYQKGEKSDRNANCLANLCTLGHFSTLSQTFCAGFTSVFDTIDTGLYGYKYWPKNAPFLRYSAAKDDVDSEVIMSTTLNMQSVFNIYLARFSKEGQFKRFEELDSSFVRCNMNQSLSNVWRKFGTIFSSNCSINLHDIIEGETTDFFDPFIADNTVDGKVVLRPIPVFDLNYADNVGQSINMLSTPTLHRYGRRFFIFDNYSTNAYVQFIQNFAINFELSSDGTRVVTPYISVRYAQYPKGTYPEMTPSLHEPSLSVEYPYYSFSVNYSQDMEKFWFRVIVLFATLTVITLVVLIYRSFVFVRLNGEDGTNSYVIIGVLEIVIDSFGTLVLICLITVTLYVSLFYKYQKTTFTLLPNEDEFSIMYSFLWAASILKCISTFLEVYLKTSGDIFLVDWEAPHHDEQPVSAWRRIMVCNEWNKIQTVRCYSVPFTLASMVLIMTGLNYGLLSTPTPGFNLYDYGNTHSILRFALVISLFILLAIIQYLWCEVIYWRFFGDPYLNFMDLCSTSNISVLSMESPQHGFYIHGRSVHSHADETMQRLNNNLTQEAHGLTGTRGLIPDTTEQVFEGFFERDFRQRFVQKYYEVQANVQTLSVRTAASSPQETMNGYKDLNLFLKRFYDMSQADHRVTVLNRTYGQKLLGVPPSIETESILEPKDDRGFRETMISGIEWRLMSFYALLFICIDLETKSPSIAAFIVYIFDLIVIQIFQSRGKSNLARKALLDNRFLL